MMTRAEISRRRALVATSAVVAAALLCGCSVGPDFHRPASPVVDHYLPRALPTQTGSTPGERPQAFAPGQGVDGRWWTQFGSPTLDAFEDEALRRNANLAAARAALRQAHELYLAQRAARFPTVQLTANGARSKNSETLASPLSSNAQTYSLYAGQLDIAYALDVFGALRRQIEAAAAQAENQRYEAAAAYVALTSNVASTVLQIAGLRSQLAATERGVAANRQILEITRRRHALGEDSSADVAAAESALEQAEQAAPGLRKQIGQASDQLAVYLGRSPAEAEILQLDLSAFRLPHELPVSLPSSLVRQRPDVLAAEASVHVASAQVGVAVAARLPSFTIDGTLGGNSESISSLFTPANSLWSIGGSASQSIFDAGALRHQQRAAEAGLAQAQEQYRAAVLAALKDTADALQAIVYDAETLRHAALAADAAARSSAIARTQYAHGEGGALAVLSAAVTDDQAQAALVQARAARYADTVALLQALGGGWWNSAEASGEARR
jgi:NodT family efflux transporter outer membrane factor (OMF) lipoprotein